MNYKNMFCFTKKQYVMIFLLHHLNHQHLQALPIYNIGIYSICSNSPNRTTFNEEAENFDDIISSMLGDIQRTFLPEPSNYYVYHSFDVCNNETMVLEIIVQLLLDEQYAMKISGVYQKRYSIIQLFLLLPEHLTKLIFEAFSFTDIAVVYPKLQVSDSGAMFSNELTSWVDSLLQLVLDLRWQSVHLISVTDKEKEFPYHIYYKESIKAFSKVQKCVQFSHYRKSEVIDVDNITLADPTRALIFFGDIRDQIMVYKKMVHENKNNDRLVLFHDKPNSWNCIKHDDHTYKTIKRAFNLLNDKRKRYGLKKSMFWTALTKLTEDKITDSYLVQFFYSIVEAIGLFTLNIMSFTMNPTTLTVGEFYQRRELNKKNFLVSDGKQELTIYDNHTNAGDLCQRRVSFRESRTKTQQTYCPSVICEAGYQKIYSNVSNSFTWMCVKCPKGSYKSKKGNSSCLSCSGQLSVPNEHQTGCQDPFKHSHVSFMENEVILLLIICVLGSFLNNITLFFFIRKKHTPVVATSDFAVSIAHLVVIQLLFIFLPVTLIGEPSIWKCISRSVSICTFYVISISFVFVKSQKLLRAFGSKIVLSRNQARKTMVIQAFTILIFLLATNCLLIITSIHVQPRIVIERDLGRLLRVYHCNTHQHISVVIGFIILLQLGCFVQAFRARNLPSLLNDSMLMVYTAFIITIVFGITFPIVHFQSPIYKDLFQGIAVATNNLIVGVLLYGTKCVFMLRHPEKNSRRYFREQNMKELRLNFDANKTIKRRHGQQL